MKPETTTIDSTTQTTVNVEGLAKLPPELLIQTLSSKQISDQQLILLYQTRTGHDLAHLKQCAAYALCRRTSTAARIFQEYYLMRVLIETSTGLVEQKQRTLVVNYLKESGTQEMSPRLTLLIRSLMGKNDPSFSDPRQTVLLALISLNRKHEHTYQEFSPTPTLPLPWHTVFYYEVLHDDHTRDLYTTWLVDDLIYDPSNKTRHQLCSFFPLFS